MKAVPNVVLRLFVNACQIAISTCVATASVDAATLSAVSFGTFSSPGRALYLNGGSDNFDTIFFQARPTAPSLFANARSGLVSGAPRLAGDLFTYPNRVLTGDPLDDPSFKGMVMHHLVNTPTELSFWVSKLDGKISTNGNLFLANVYLQNALPDGIAQVALYSGGQQVFTTSTTFHLAYFTPPLPPPPLRPPAPLPEPTTAGLAGLALIVVAAYRRKGRGPVSVRPRPGG